MMAESSATQWTAPNPGGQSYMNDFPSDEKRLDATEAQMRRALGLQDGSSLAPQPAPPVAAPSGPHRQPRRFVRDGEVPVTVIHRDENSATNQLGVARQTIRSLTAAKEQAERLLGEAQTAIRDLQTKLAHERLARDEAVSRAETDRQALQAVQDELAAERDARQRTEQRLAEALQNGQKAERRHWATGAAQEPQEPPQAPRRRGRPRKNASPVEATLPQDAPLERAVEGTSHTTLASVPQSFAKPSNSKAAMQTRAPKPVEPRRRGRPPKVRQPEAEVVQWWLPGWQEWLR